MPRLRHAPGLHQAVLVGLAAMLVVSCSETVDKAPATASDQPQTAAPEIVVTGQRRDEAFSELKDGPAPVEAYAPSPPPAPPPSPIVVTADKMNRAGGLVASQSWSAASPATTRGKVMAAPRIAGGYERDFRVVPPPYHDVGRDKFTAVSENPFKLVQQEPVSTFSIDVDTASYAFVRASLNRNVLPQPAAVRTEELVNYFPYHYAAPRSAEQPFSTNVAVFPSPWTPGRKLVRIGIKGYAIQHATRPRANLVFLVDTSGSMNEPNKLPLVKQSLSMLVNQLDRDDRVSIVTYAGYAGTALAPTRASDKEKILAVIDGLGAGGGTAGAEGIRQAYTLAEQNLDREGVNRVILATDGDFNIGITNQDELKGYIERERGKGVFLSVLGFGMGNYNDALMQTLAQNGNGAAAYIDTIGEARKTLVDEATSTLFPIAKDVKIQVEFNPATVAEYRLVGYETRMLNRDDFDNDKVDAGDVGSGQTVTALYEVVPVGGPRAIGDLRYSRPSQPVASRGTEYGFVKIRYKLPKSDTSRLISTPIDRASEAARFEDAPQDARFATGVAAFAELLRGGKYSGSMTYDDVLQVALGARGEDGFGYRSEFVQLIRAAKSAGAIARLE